MENQSTFSGWRPVRDHKPPFDITKGEKPGNSNEIPTTRFFDQLAFIGNEWVGCFVLETPAGILLIDCLEPDEDSLARLLAGLKTLGHDPSEVKVVLVTHGHPDHYGVSDYFQRIYGTKLYMSKVDELYARDPNTRRPPHRKPMPMAMDGNLEDMQVFSFGGHDITIVSTPGHTPGGMSFIIPVTDEGRPHRAALWGGTGLNISLEEKRTYLQSSIRFNAVCSEMGVDVEISTHPFIDNTKERLAVCRNITNGVANPFVIGASAATRYQQMFTDMCIESMKKG